MSPKIPHANQLRQRIVNPAPSLQSTACRTEVNPLASCASGDATVEVVDPLAYELWDASLDAFSEATCFHTRAWLQVLKNSYGHRSIGFLVRANGKLRGMAPLVVADSLWLGRRAACVGFADMAELLAGDAGTCLLLRNAIVEHGATEGWKTVEFRGGRRWLGGAKSSTTFRAHELDLTPGPVELLSRLESATRRNIRKAERDGVRTEVSHSASAMEHYYRLHCRTRRRLGSPPQPARFFESIWEHFVRGGKGVVALAWRERAPAAGVVILMRGTQALYKFGASDERFQHLRPSNAAMWAAISHCAESGMRRYHFGRTSMHDEGLRRFKLGWGATESLLEYFRLDVRSGAMVEKRDAAGGWPSRLLRRLPIPLMRGLGNVLYPHLI